MKPGMGTSDIKQNEALRQTKLENQTITMVTLRIKASGYKAL